MKKTLPLILGLTLATPSIAQVGVGAVGGTLGAGAYIGYEFNEYIGVRVQGTYWNTSDSQNIDGIDYKADLEIGAIGAYADIFPFQGTFRITAGFSNSLTKAEVTNTSSGVVRIGDGAYTINQGDLYGKGDFGSAPYLGIGWGRTAPEGFGFRFDIGAHFLGKPSITYEYRGNNPTVKAALDATGDLEKEAQNAENDIGDVVYPEVSLTISYGW